LKLGSRGVVGLNIGLGTAVVAFVAFLVVAIFFVALLLAVLFFIAAIFIIIYAKGNVYLIILAVALVLLAALFGFLQVGQTASLSVAHAF
jgi:hypothetical protein